MSMLNVTLPDGTVKEVSAGTTPLDVARSIGGGLARQTVAAYLGDDLVDAYRPIESDARLRLVTLNTPEGLGIYRHSTAHLMAHAVKELFGREVQVTIGPAIESGFYYDFFSDTHTFSPEEFDKIEQKMAELAKDNLPIERQVVSSTEAIALFRELGEEYKVELIEDLGEDEVTLYRQGTFVDLCRGPHIPSTGMLKVFKLTSVAGAYWRGDEKNAMLQRIYATAFTDKKELKKHLHRLEEA